MTDWSLVGRAGSEVRAIREQAIHDILSAYYPVMTAHVARRFHLSRADAEDHVHQFIADKVLIKNIIGSADRDRGRFRSFLVRVVDNFVITELRRQTRRRSAAVDVAVLEDLPDPDGTAPSDFERDWATHVLQGAIAAMETFCQTASRKDVWRVFQLRALDPMLRGHEPVPYDVLISDLGLSSPTAAMELLASAKRMFQRHVRQELLRFAHDPADIEQELAAFHEIVLK